jgi:biliverdin reductase
MNIGIVGTGFVASLRAELLSQDPRVKLQAIAGNYLKAQAIAAEFGMRAYEFWSQLVIQPDIDLVIVATINRDHGAVVAQALNAGKHVIVEYPLCLAIAEATALVELARHKNLMLHIEHIELLGGVYQTVKQLLPQIGEPVYIRYVTQSPQAIAPDKWTYRPELFGFPFIAATSRLHRLIVPFGKVSSVSCQLRYFGEDLPDRYTSCVCNAQLEFVSGAIADVNYTKGENFWKPERSLEIQATQGAILFDGESGKLITAAGETLLTAEPSRGLFKKDTDNVLAHLLEGQPLYTHNDTAVHALAVACAAEEAALTKQVVKLT